MSHFSVTVLVRHDIEDIEAEVARLLAPFNENTDVPEYKSFMSDENVTSMKEYYVEHEGLSPEATLEDMVPLLQSWQDSDGGVEEGRLYYLTTYNPLSKWDWYRIGGRWDGLTQLEPKDCPICDKNDMEAISHHYSEAHQQLTNNCARVSDLPPDYSTYAILDEGGWHERGHMGWFGSSDEKDDWPETEKRIYAEHPDHIAVVVDCHI